MITPMFVMVLLTFFIGCAALKVRFASVKNGEVKARYFKLMSGDDVPEVVTKTTRCFNNQFEIPLLFYVGCTLYVSLGIESLLALVCAWLFVFFRIIHALIHLTYNHVIHRMLAFWFAFVSVFILWVNLLQHAQVVL